MKRMIFLLVAIFLLFTACSSTRPADVAATTLPVFEFATILCENTDITVTRIITENVSCLHDYTLNVKQMQAIESAQVVLISGAGLEIFMDRALYASENVIDCSNGISLIEPHEHDHENHNGGHVHAEDPHIWLSPENAKIMASNICRALCQQFPQWTTTFQHNLKSLLLQLDELQAYGDAQLKDLDCRQIITFHDGFGYLAESFDLTILRAIEEESGSEASAAELIDLITEVNNHNLSAIFVEQNGSDSAASIIARETGAKIFTLNMAMSGDSYFEAMYHNINTLREALHE